MKKRSFYVKIDDISLKTALLKNICCTKQKLSKIKERNLKAVRENKIFPYKGYT